MLRKMNLDDLANQLSSSLNTMRNRTLSSRRDNLTHVSKELLHVSIVQWPVAWQRRHVCGLRCGPLIVQVALSL
jgi:hypothetical protein